LAVYGSAPSITSRKQTVDEPLTNMASGAAMTNATPGERAASVASSRSGRRRPPPDASQPLTVEEFVAQLHVKDLTARFSKEKEELLVTTSAPRDRSTVLDVKTLRTEEAALLQKYTKTHQMATSFRKAKMRTNGNVRDAVRQHGLAVLPHAKRAVEAGQPGLPVRLQNENGEVEDYFVKPHVEKRKAAAPGIGAALDCVREAADAVIQKHLPELKGVLVTEENMKDVLRAIMRPDVGAALMNSIEETVNQYQLALGTTTETVHLVRKKDFPSKVGGPPGSSIRQPMRYAGDS